MLTKEEILTRVSPYVILDHYLKPFHSYEQLTQGVLISNPFHHDKQKAHSPSFKILCSFPEHCWIYKDIVTAEKGDCFDLVQRLFKLSLAEALVKISTDFNLNSESAQGGNVSGSDAVGESPTGDTIEPSKSQEGLVDSLEQVESAGDSSLQFDFEKFGIGRITPAETINHLTECLQSENLKKVLAGQKKLKLLVASDITFSKPIICQNGNAVIFPRTINGMQGQAGVHKSRLAAVFCSVVIIKPGYHIELLGYEANFMEPYTVIYVDTERNLTDQLPFAIQTIQMEAGYQKTDHPANFEYISLLMINRKERFATLIEYLDHIRRTTNKPLFIVLDVSTDCIEDFNRSDKSMELIDSMNMAINESDVTFLCLIHENPGSEKARGHFGTELMNKSSTFIRVGFEKDSKNDDTDIIKVKYLKCRSTAKHSPLYLKYCDESKGLVLADSDEVSDLVSSRKQKAHVQDVAENLEMLLGDGATLTRRQLLDRLIKEFKASDRTIEDRLLQIIEEKIEMINEKGESCVLFKETIEKILYYKLKSSQIS